MGKRITEQLYKDIKRHQRQQNTPQATMATCDISWKTYMQCSASKTWDIYTALNKSQHPDTVYSLRDDVLYLHRLIFRHDDTYIPPQTAKQAIQELKANAS